MTIKRGDSGSAPLLEIKCVIIEAPKLNTKSDINWCRQQKMTKNDQKLQNIKIDKIDKIIKTQKATKSEKWKSEKVTKRENENMKNVKNHQNPKNPKMSLKWHFLTLCEIRAAWSGTFWVPGGTTGPDS